MKLHLSLIFLCMFAVNLAAATPITIHVYNPWVDNPYRQDSISILGNNEVGYHPGTKMESDGAGWFTFIFKTMPINLSDGFQFASYIGNQYDAYSKKVVFPTSTITFHYLDSLFTGSTEFWVIPDDSVNKYKLFSTPPAAKVIHLFNPWPDNSPQIVIGNKDARRMRVNTNICGWYTYFYNGVIDSLKQVSFTDYYATSKYMSGGIDAGKPIDLSTIFSTKDTIYIVPKPFPSGPPSIWTTFPGKIGDCPTRELSAIVYDQKMDMISFFDGSIRNGKVVKGMVQNQLGPNRKPVRGANAHAGYGDSLESWFITKKVNDTDSNRTCVQLKFTKGYDGRWEFDSDLSGGFFPIDDFNPWKDKLYAGDDKRMHNFHFTMEMHMQFAYHQGKNQTFMFRGDDDVWIFVNNTLAIDLGSLHNASTTDSAGRVNSSDTLRLDKVASTLGLTDGGNYPMDIFYCERQPSGSNLFIKTSIDLRNSDELFYKDSLISSGKTKYAIRQYHKTEQTGCGTTIVNTTEEQASVDFFLSGPQFQDSLKHLDSVKTYFGGIIIHSDSTFTIDSSNIKDLATGRYTITFISKYDQNRTGQVSFYVIGKDPATLFADPPDGTHFKNQQYVKLSTNADARIYFTTDGSKPDTNNAAQLYSDSIKVDKSLTIKAIAIGDNYIPASGTFSYTRDPDSVKLTADPPGGTHFLKDTTITLTATNKARIYYTTDGSQPDTTKASQLYSTPFTITGSKTNPTVTVRAIATGDYLITTSNSWTYTRDFPAATLTATPGDGTHYGDTLSITLSTNADAIYYTTDGSDPVEGSNAQLYKGPFTIVKDTVTVKAIATGNNFTSTSKQWIYFSDQVPNIKATPGSCSFVKPIAVYLSVNDDSAKIYYTLDGSEPTINSTPYTGAITISTTTQLKARAFANNKVPSAILTENYVRKSIPLEAFYYDRNADGNIDSVSVILDFKASTLPDTLSISAYTKIKRAILKDQLKLSDDGLLISAVINPQLSSGGQKDDDAGSGALKSPLFDTTEFAIKDNVAPVLVSAVFAPDLIEENMKKLGTLSVKFSEPVQSITSEYPFNFYQNGTQYKLKLQLVSVFRENAVFSVLAVEGVNFPKDKVDSLNIAPSQGIKDAHQIEQNNPNNIKISLNVLPQPYAVKFRIGPNPFEPGISKLSATGDGITITSGTVITADFKANLKSDAEKIKADISIYDPVGNILCKATESCSINGLLEVKKITTTTTKVFFVWSGYNKSGRKVGTGSYVAKVRVTAPSGKVFSYPCMIGIKR